jgi:hypothetical protein
VRAKCGISQRLEIRQRQPSRAVSRIRNSGRSNVFGVEADRFDHEVEFVGAVDFARYAVSHSGLDEQGFGEVIEPVNPLVSRSSNRNTAHERYSVRESRNR